MRDVRKWLAARIPVPPAPLASWLDAVDGPDRGVQDPLLSGGLRELDAARSAPGRVRESAFHLLAADALLSYACEAALESPDPNAALQEIIRKAAAPTR